MDKFTRILTFTAVLSLFILSYFAIGQGITVNDLVRSHLLFIFLTGTMYLSFLFGVKKHLHSAGFIVIIVMTIQLIIFKLYLNQLEENHPLEKTQLMIFISLFFVYLLYILVLITRKLNKV